MTSQALYLSFIFQTRNLWTGTKSKRLKTKPSLRQLIRAYIKRPLFITKKKLINRNSIVIPIDFKAN